MTIKNKKTYLVLGVSLVVLLVSYSSLGAINAYATPSNTKFNVQEDEISNEILQQASQKPQHSKDVTFLNLEKRIHGFSGAYVDENGVLNIYTTDPTIKSIDKSALTDYVKSNLIAKEIIVKQSNHSWHKWIQLENITLELFDNKDLGITMMGVDDKNQVYSIGFEKLNDTNTNTVNVFLTTHNIPLDMVSYIETGKIIPVRGDDTTPAQPVQRHDYSPITINPIAPSSEIGVSGAAALGQWSYTPHCTLGLIAKKTNGQNVGLTAGHCQGPNNWNTQTQTFTQPYSTTSQNSQHIYPNNGRSIGTAITTTTNLSYSDTLLFGITETQNFGKIYDGVSYKSIKDKDYAPFVGETVSGYGATTGSTVSSTIAQTGISFYDDAIGKTIAGQIRASFVVAGGDSGGPVWHNNADGTVTFVGTMVAKFGSANTLLSPIGGIEFDQGILQVK